MEAAFAELPLALFTTLAPAAAGAYAALALAFCTTSFSDEQLRRIDRMTLIPLVVMVVGFICAFFHLASPLNAMGVFAGTGSSPLSNELLVAMVFAVLVVVYTLLALVGKLSGGVRKGFAVVVGIVAVVFAAFVGLAYLMETITSWNSPLVPVQMVGYMLVAGAGLGALVLGLAGALEEACAGACKSALVVMSVAGVLVGAIAGGVQVSGVSGMSTWLVSGADLFAEAMPVLAGGIVCLVLSAIALIAALRGKGTVGLAGASAALAIVGVFLMRLAFYATQLSVGLTVM